MGGTLRAALLLGWLAFAGTSGAPLRAQASPATSYDLFLRSDSGAVQLWINTATGDFRWVDRWRKIDFSARGTLAFPNLGPMVLSYSGEAPGYDWALVALKLYGTSATGSLTLFPAGEKVHKVVSLLWDADTRNDKPWKEKKGTPPPKPPEVGDIRTEPKPEVPKPQPMRP